MHWDRYIGIPYTPHGRSRDGLDCGGLVIMIYREALGIEIPDHEYETEKEARDRFILKTASRGSNWHKVDTPAPFDVVSLNMFGHPTHCAVVVDPPLMIHTGPEIGSRIERWTTPQWKRRVEGFFRWVA